MNLSRHPFLDTANATAADRLTVWLPARGLREMMVAGGKTPQDPYRRVAERPSALNQLTMLAFDEPRNCAARLRQAAAEATPIAAMRG